jgi:serine-type D-Ala-D-Ala carboxypeptidase/endopeptidase (penicillin-binding protein 4)
MNSTALALIIAFFFSCGVNAHGGSLSLEEFQGKMRSQISALSKKTRAAVRVEVLGTGRELFSANENEKMIPASNAKILTSSAALAKLGPGYTFETKVYLEGENLVLAGNGDPYLVSERLWLLARDVARSGLKKVGSIRVNTSAFSENYTGLMDFQDSGEPFTAIVAPTSLNFNSVEVHVLPDPSGKRPRVEAGPVPHAYAILQNEVSQTSGSGKNVTVRPVRVEGDKEVFAVTGSMGKHAAPVIVYAAVSQPEAYIASVFAALLRKEGVAVGRDFGGISREVFGPDKPALATLPSLPLRELVSLYNTFSNNYMAEQVFLALSGAKDEGPHTAAKSRAVEAEYLKRESACSEVDLDNGSGLSWDTHVTANCLLRTMQNAYRDFQVFTDLLSSLPIGGQTGTLKNRFKHAKGGFEIANVRAKTGTLWSKQVVTSLAGVTTTTGGERAVFVFLENDQRREPGLLRELKDWEDRCVELIQQLQI